MSQGTTWGLVAFFSKAYPYRTALTVLLVGAAGLLEGVGVATLIPALAIVEGGGTANDPFSRFVADMFANLGLVPTLPALLAFMFVTVLLKSGAVWLAMVQVEDTVITIVGRLRLRLVSALLGARWKIFATQKGGEWANAVGLEAQASGNAYSEACQIGAAVFPIAAYAVLATTISWPITLLAAVSGIVVLGSMRGFVNVSRSAGKEWAAGDRRLTALIADVMQGLKPVKSMAREALLLPVFERVVMRIVYASRRDMHATRAVGFFHEPTVVLIMIGAILYVSEFSALSLSTVVVLAFTYYRIMAHLRTVQGRYQLLVRQEAKFWSLMDRITQAETEREDLSPGQVCPELTESLVFQSVSFSYGDTPVIDDLSLTVPQGTFVAIHGESGSGKTTMVDLIVGLHRPSHGRILVDGLDLSSVDLHAWRGRIGYVPQEMLLLNGTIRMNVTLGDETIDDVDVEEALKLAGAWDFVVTLDGVLDAETGERGAMLSGGQRQRIAIARALVNRPSLLILDEVTTALDPVTEAAICETLKSLAGMATIISISHQEALREAADEVYEMRDGALRPAHQVTPT